MEDSGTLKLLATDNQPAQRLVFSPHGKPLYVNDTCVKKLYVHDFMDGEIKASGLRCIRKGPG